MAQQVNIVLTDDTDGTVIEKGKGGPVTFALDGRSYEIDLTDQNAEALRAALHDYIGVARLIGRKTGVAGKRTQLVNLDEVRRWAKGQGMEVSDRGRISKKVMEAWEAR